MHSSYIEECHIKMNECRFLKTMVAHLVRRVSHSWSSGLFVARSFSSLGLFEFHSENGVGGSVMDVSRFSRYLLAPTWINTCHYALESHKNPIRHHIDLWRDQSNDLPKSECM